MQSFNACLTIGLGTGLAIGVNVFLATKDINLAICPTLFCFMLGMLSGKICSLLEKK